MTVLFNNEYNDNSINIEYFFEDIKKVIKESLVFENFNLNCEISVYFVDNKKIKEINKNFRNIDSPTDVLSFPQIEFVENFEKFLDYNENNEIILGDIIISVEKAIFQANEYGHSLEREIMFLVVHSMLHLLGYDHIVKEQEEIMFKKQEKILNNLGFTR